MMNPDNELYRGDNDEEIAAHKAFEAQLRHTAEMIVMELDDHFHFSDDCGDYLKAGLRLSSEMQDARMDGTASLLAHMKSLLVEAPDSGYLEGEAGFESAFDRCVLLMDYAGDGVADELLAWAESQLVAVDSERSTCRHCGRAILKVDGAWVDPDATGDDAVWFETCAAHDTFTAEHEPAL